MKSDGIVVYDFDLVDPGKIHTRSVVVSKEVTEVTLSKWTNPLDIQFSIAKFFEKTIVVTYKPERQNQYSCNYFDVQFLNGDPMLLILRGRTYGLSVSCNKPNLSFVCAVGSIAQERIVLENKSEAVLCNFLFTNVTLNGSIQINPISGQIPSGKKLSVTVTFSPREKGGHYERIVCLIHSHEPLIINIYAMAHQNPKYELFKYINFIENIWMGNGYSNLFLHCPEPEDRTELLVTLSDYFLQFEPAHPFGDVTASYKTFSLSSRSPVPLKIEWSQDPNGAFVICPRNPVLPPSSKITFKVTFRPCTPSLVYWDVLKANLRWGSNFSFTAPFPVSIHFLGHSFLKEACGWPALYYLKSNIVTMPPTTPTRSVFTSIVLKKTSSLPMMFRFQGPHRSHFAVYPKEGLITTDYQIVIFKLTPLRGAFMAYKETWKLILNLSTEVNIELIGTAELPLLSLSSGSSLKFPHAYVNSCITSGVQIKNLTRHILKYNFILKEEENAIMPNGKNFILFPSEQTELPLVWCPKRVGLLSTTAFIDASIVEMEAPNVKTLLTITGSAEEPKFECIPLMPDFGNVICHCTTVRPIMLQILGDAKAKLKLSCKPADMFTDAEVSIEPKDIILIPQQPQKISIRVKPCQVGMQGLSVTGIFQDLFVDTKFMSTYKNVIKKRNDIQLAFIKYNSMFSNFKIMDIKVHPIGPFVSKYCAWKIFKVDKLNKMLGSVNLGGKKISIKLPDGEFLQSPTQIDFLIRNESALNGKLSIIKHTCTCWSDLRIKPWKKVPCRHDQISISSSEDVIKVNQTRTYEMTIRYLDELQTACVYTIEWWADGYPNEKESLTVEFITSCIKYPSGGGDICFETTDEPLRLQSVALSEVLHPPIQVIWLYNNTRIATEYKISFVGKDAEYFECFNRSGMLEGKSLHPLLIQFVPFKYRDYKVFLLLEVESSFKSIDVVACGVNENQQVGGLCMPSSNLFPSPYPAILSKCYLQLSVVTHSKTERLIHLTSYTDISLFFEWSTFEIEGLLKVTVFPERGILKGRDCLPCLVTVETYSPTLKLLATASVKFMGADETLQWLKNHLNYNKVARTFDSCFVIKEEYSNPQGIKLGKQPECFHDVLTLNIDCKERTMTKDSKQCLPKYSSLFQTPSEKMNLDINDAIVAATFFHRSIGLMLKTTDFMHIISPSQYPPTILYQDAVMAYENNENQRWAAKKRPKQLPDYKLSGRCLATIFNMMLFEHVAKDFKITSPKRNSSNYSF